MSLRDYFAAKAMQSLLTTIDEFPDEHWRTGVAMDAYAMAEAMLAARASGEQPAQPAPDADGWIEWRGGECPVPADTMIWVELLSGEQIAGLAARFHWDHRDQPSDIVRYCVVRKAQP